MKQSILCVITLFLFAGGLRFYHLERRWPFSDEAHYRADMRNAYPFLLSGKHRQHSLTHAITAPHGFVAMIGAYETGRLLRYITPLIPQGKMQRDNFLSRAFYALCGTLCVLVLFVFARELYGTHAAIFVMLLAAISPYLVKWSRTEYLDVPATLFGLLAFFASWRIIQERQTVRLWLYAGAMGSLAALMIGTKWSNLLLIPFLLSGTVLCRWHKFGILARREDFFAFVIFLIMFAIVALFFLSYDSFVYVLFPPQKPHDYNASISEGLWKPLDFSNGNVLPFLFLWDGPLFGIFFVVALWRLFHLDFKKTDGREMFLMNLLTGVYLFTHIQGTQSSWWRAYFLVSVCMLLVGLCFEKCSVRQLVYAAALVIVTTIPLSVYEGLRKGEALFFYPGNRFTYYDNLVTDDFIADTFPVPK